MANKGLVTNVEIGDEKTQKDYYDKAKHYNTLWGEDNIHLGYYPHLNGGPVVLTFPQAADLITERMVEVGRITHTSTLLDLGCGKGKACVQIAERTGAACTGVDIGTENVRRANEVATAMPQLKLKFLEGSFTDLPAEVTGQKYSHVFAQLAFCHVHKELPAIFETCKRVLAPGGKLVVMDYLGCDGTVTEETKTHVHKRLHFDMLHGHKAFRRIAEEAGLVIQYYENLDDHMSNSYQDLSEAAYKHGFKSADGMSLGENYAKTVVACQTGQIGMNIAILTLPASRL